ncbi:uncharacterized protein [Diadema setosum]|uniref:uncharacterized protein n=1 Tax=Diadema setosum TaxID=31175 RepID=UPI003B3A763F
MLRRRNNFRAWKQCDMEAALRRIQLGEQSIRAAARDYGLPRATVQDKLHGRTPVCSRQGPSPVLTNDEEARLVNWIVDMSRVGLCQGKANILNVIKRFLDDDKRDTPFHNNKPGQAWWEAFLRRHPTITLRKPQPIGKERAILTPGRIDRWLREFEEYLVDNAAQSILEEPRRMFNCDESGFALGGRVGTRVLAEKGAKIVHELKNSDKTQITVLATVSAAGKYLPPMIILPGERAGRGGNPMEGAPPGAFFSRTKSGWIDSKAFYGYIANVFHPYLVQKRVPLPVLLLVDGHPTHQSPEVSEFCHNKGIILYRLPPHATHVIQPCDVSLFRSLKSAWYDAERQYRFQHPGDFVTKTTFSSVFRFAWERVTANKEVAKSGFRAAGLYPFSKDYNRKHLIPSSIYNFPAPSTQDADASDPFTSAGGDTASMAPSSSTPAPSSSTPAIFPSTPASSPDTQPNSPTFVPPSLEEYIPFPRVDVVRKRKRREQLPEVISGEQFLKLVAAKRQKKAEEEQSKQRRKKEREEKKREKEQRSKEKKNSKRREKSGGKCKRKSANEDDDYECPQCTSHSRDHEQWVMCDRCERWYHLRCTAIVDLTAAEIEALPFFCILCTEE